MSRTPFRAAMLVAVASLGLAGCSAYDRYGYSSLSVGYGTGYYDGYGGYGSPYYGWYDGFYYPGTGYYIYDRGGQRHRWNGTHQRYWEGRRGDRSPRSNWDGFRQGGRDGRPAVRPRSQDNSPNYRRDAIGRDGTRQNRGEARQPRGEARQPSGEARQPRGGWQGQSQGQGQGEGRGQWRRGGRGS